MDIKCLDNAVGHMGNVSTSAEELAQQYAAMGDTLARHRESVEKARASVEKARAQVHALMLGELDVTHDFPGSSLTSTATSTQTAAAGPSGMRLCTHNGFAFVMDFGNSFRIQCGSKSIDSRWIEQLQLHGWAAEIRKLTQEQKMYLSNVKVAELNDETLDILFEQMHP